MKAVYIVAAKRTPIGSFGGSLAGLTAVQLGAAAMQGAISAAGIDAAAIQEVYFGNVCSAGLGQSPARQAAIAAGLSINTPATNVNKVCASGTKAIMLAAQSIMLGLNDVVLAGGMESMSNVPYYVPKARFGYKYGNAQLIDGLHHDGLEDPYQHKAMGVFADATAKKYDISREQQDEFAINSYKQVAANTDNGNLANEITPVSIPQRKGEPVVISTDEEYKNVKFDKIPGLRAAFTPDGTVTAANASTINDGAAALILVSEEKMKELGLTPLARVVSFADHEQEPEWFTTAPAFAVPKALERAGLNKSQISAFEVNEAFAVVPMAFNKLMDIDPSLVNCFGGAVALGHPLGASGARIVTTLINVLNTQGGQYGVAGICNGGGGASALVLERV